MEKLDRTSEEVTKSNIKRFSRSNVPISKVFGNLPMGISIGFNIMRYRSYTVFVTNPIYISQYAVVPFSENKLHQQKP